MNPAQLTRLLQTALEHHNQGRLSEAEKLYRQVLKAAPKLFDPLHLLGTLEYQKGKYKEAEKLLSSARALNPAHGMCQMRLGMAVAALGRFSEAEPHLRAATTKEPRVHHTWNNLAATLRALGQVDEAIKCYQHALTLEPNAAETHDQLGALLADTAGLARGTPHFRRAVELQPSFAQAWCNLGLSLVGERNYPDALQAFERALGLHPELHKARVGRALAYQQTYEVEQAAAEFKTVLEKEPAHHEARSAFLLTLNYLPGRTRAADFEEHRAFGTAAEKAAKPAHLPPAAPKSKLRLAFLSPDLRNHAVAYFLEPLARHLDRNQWELFFYHDHFQVDAMSERLKQLADTWRNFVGQPNVSVEAAIRADAPDILVDLAGHTGINRLSLFARRLATVQATYLGYPNTTGLKEMDFRLVDEITDPSDEDQLYHTEKLVRFSPCAWAYEPPSNSPGTDRATRTLPGITFGSFNNLSKLSVETLHLWGRVLEKVPNARLLLKGHGLQENAVRGMLEGRLGRAGVPVDRVVFAPRTPDTLSHLALYQHVDVALDAFPYHGTTTTCEALWMGVPVVTLEGDRHASRVGKSLLTAVGCREWVASTPDDYVRIAAELASATESHTDSARQKLRQRLQESILMDHAGQSARFASALKRCWDQRSQGL